MYMKQIPIKWTFGWKAKVITTDVFEIIRTLDKKPTTMYFKGRVTLFYANNYLTESRITMEF